MKYYFSGMGIHAGPIKERLAFECPYRLQSCHSTDVKSAYEWAELASRNPGQCELMLDSGAFTAWSKGQEVNINELIKVYSDIVEKYGDKLKEIWLINLDKIPGSIGRTATRTELDESMRISDANFNRLVRIFGDRVLPVFHQNESEERLKDVAAMADYICVSPRNDLPEQSRVLWSQYVHTILPDIKTHGLATTGVNMLSTVSWFSADSATWIFAGRVGELMVMKGAQLFRVNISADSPCIKKFNSHFLTMALPLQEYVLSRIALHGYGIEALKRDYNTRMAFNMLETIKWVKQLEVKPVKQNGLFGL